MRRSGKASDKAVKRLRHRTLKRRHPEKVGRKHPSIDLAERVALLEHRLNETLDQQTATSEILRVIASSPTEIQSVLDAIVTTVARLIDVADAHILRVEGQSLTTMATHGSSPQWAIGTTRAINRNWVTGRAVVDGKTVHVRDLQAAQSDFPEGAAYAKQYGHRTTLATPLLREGSPTTRSAKRSASCCCKTSPLKPSSPSRTPGCSTNCANLCSSRPPPPTC